MGKSGFGSANLVVALMFSYRTAFAAEPYSLGERGQLLIDDRIELAAGRNGDQRLAQSTRFLQLNPSAAYFVARRLALGLGVALAYGNHEYQRFEVASLGVAPRVGYVIPLAERFDLYPELEGRVTRTWQWDNDVTLHADQLDLALSAPVLFKPAPHFFVGLGPTLKLRAYQTTFVGDSRDPYIYSGGAEWEKPNVTWGVTSTLGGYFDI